MTVAELIEYASSTDIGIDATIVVQVEHTTYPDLSITGAGHDSNAVRTIVITATGLANE